MSTNDTREALDQAVAEALDQAPIINLDAWELDQVTAYVTTELLAALPGLGWMRTDHEHFTVRKVGSAVTYQDQWTSAEAARKWMQRYRKDCGEWEVIRRQVSAWVVSDDAE